MKDNQFCIIIYEKMSVNNQVMPRNTSKSVVPNVELGSITVEWTVLLKEFALVLDWKMQHVRAFCWQLGFPKERVAIWEEIFRNEGLAKLASTVKSAGPTLRKRILGQLARQQFWALDKYSTTFKRQCRKRKLAEISRENEKYPGEYFLARAKKVKLFDGKSQIISTSPSPSVISNPPKNSPNLHCVCMNQFDKNMYYYCVYCATWIHPSCVGEKRKANELGPNYQCIICKMIAYGKGNFVLCLDGTNLRRSARLRTRLENALTLDTPSPSPTFHFVPRSKSKKKRRAKGKIITFKRKRTWDFCVLIIMLKSFFGKFWFELVWFFRKK